MSYHPRALEKSIEIKWTRSPTSHDARHLESFLNDVPSSRRGYVVCRVREPRQITSRVTAIPWDQI